MSSELGPMFYDARIVGVIEDRIVRGGKTVVVVGPRDVGKSLFIQLVIAKLINYTARKAIQRSKGDEYQQGEMGADRHSSSESKGGRKRVGFIPILVSCEDAARVARMNYIKYVDQDGEVELVPVVFIDDSHLCENFEVERGKVVKVYPTWYRMQKIGDDSTTIHILPFRLVEVAELVHYHLPNIRKHLIDQHHYKGVERLNNLANPKKVCEIVKSLNKIVDLVCLGNLFRLYALHGGTARGVELIHRALRDVKTPGRHKPGVGELSYVANVFMRTIDHVIHDADALKVDRVATKYLLYYLSDIDKRKSLEVNPNEMYEKVKNEIEKSLGINVKKERITEAFNYLRESFIIIRFKPLQQNKADRSEIQRQDSTQGSNTQQKKSMHGANKEKIWKVFFTDPRYFLGAYLKSRAEEEPEHHVSVFKNKIADCILGEGEKGCEWVSHYFEGLALLNVALGVYAAYASANKQKSSEKFDKYLQYIRGSDIEIDGTFNIGEVQGLFEVSMSYDKGHVDKCREALKLGLGQYCIYAFLDDRDAECEDVGGRYLITAPLPLVLLLF